MVFTLCHLVPSKFFRVHTTFFDSGDVRHIFLVDRIKGTNAVPSGNDRIQGKKIAFHHKAKSVEYKKNLDIVLLEYEIDAFITSSIVRVDICDYIHSLDKQIFYVNHGIWNTFAGPRFCTTKGEIFWKQFDGFFVTVNEKQYLTDIGIDKNMIHIIGGSTQFDHIVYHPPKQSKQIFCKNINRKTGDLQRRTKTPLSLTTKTILVVQNCDHITDIGKRTTFNGREEAQKILIQAAKHYYYILKEAFILAKKYNYHLFTKIKSYSKEELENLHPALANIHNHPQVTVIDHYDFVLYYDLLFSDITIIEGFGTSFIESLRVNPRTVQCQLERHNDFLELNEYSLLQANSRKELREMIESLMTAPNKILTEEYQKNVQKYLLYQLGEINTGGIATDITNIIIRLCPPKISESPPSQSLLVGR